MSSGLQMRKCTVETRVAQVGVLLVVHSVSLVVPLSAWDIFQDIQ